MKKCPFCQSEIPDEAKFCLYCFSAVEKFAEDETVVTKAPKPKKKLLIPLVASLLGLVLVVSCVVIAQRASKNKISTEPNETVTILQPVTEANGEQITNENGEGVFEVITVESTTEKKGLIASLFNKDKNDSTSNTSPKDTESTTEKQGFLAHLFGKDKDDETTEGSTTSTNQEDATTNAANTTEPEATTASTTIPTTIATTTTTTTTESPTYKISDFEYDEYNGYIRILKYNGNASTLVIPARIDGKSVAYIERYAITNNTSIKKIVFEDSVAEFYLTAFMFDNLPNLKSVVLPKNSVLKCEKFPYCFSFTCPNIESITFGSQNNPSNFSVIDGVIYNKKENRLHYYPPAKQGTSFTMLNTCKTMDDAFYGCKYLKTITLGESLVGITYPLTSFYGCSSLTHIYIDANNTNEKMYSKDGILYVCLANYSADSGIPSYFTVIYPAGKQNSSYTFPTSENRIRFSEASFNGNPYIKEFKVPIYTKFSDCYWNKKKYGAPNLNKIYLKDCDDSYDVYTNTFKSVKDITIEYY